ncbi:MAG: preprotein translocase subunit SecE [bacterium]|nr:preprotein translocase subunit SecE [bacterium]
MAEEQANIVRRGQQFVKDVWEELKKVNWTTRAQLVQATKVVIISSAVLGVYLGIVDVIFSAMLKWFLEKPM